MRQGEWSVCVAESSGRPPGTGGLLWDSRDQGVRVRREALTPRSSSPLTRLHLRQGGQKCLLFLPSPCILSPAATLMATRLHVDRVDILSPVTLFLVFSVDQQVRAESSRSCVRLPYAKGNFSQSCESKNRVQQLGSADWPLITTLALPSPPCPPHTL
jgi:hypothetical protein